MRHLLWRERNLVEWRTRRRPVCRSKMPVDWSQGYRASMFLPLRDQCGIDAERMRDQWEMCLAQSSQPRALAAFSTTPSADTMAAIIVQNAERLDACADCLDTCAASFDARTDANIA